MPAKGATVADWAVTERSGLAQIRAAAATRPGTTLGIGDDAAVLDLGDRALACVDLLIDGVHFRRSAGDMESVGHKAIAVNLSDIAAMGGEPVAALVALTLPHDGMGPDELGALYEGMEREAAAAGVSIAGGDMSAGPALALAVTLLGRLPAGARCLTRAGGRPGDLLFVTGPLGAAAAGLAIDEGRAPPSATPSAPALVRALRRPRARLAEGRALAAAGARAGIDISDGLALDAARLAAESGCAAQIDLERVPVADGVPEIAAALGRDPAEFAATGGEDYELLVALGPGEAGSVAGSAALELHRVGHLQRGEGCTVAREGVPVAIGSAGWEYP
jgi:thiamine-monophosphate kinase